MPDKKISDLTSAGALSGSELLPIVQSGTTFKTLLSTLSTFVSTDVNTNAVNRVTVKLSQAINKGQAVYVSSANGTNIIVSKASNTSEPTSSKTIGLLETTGAINAFVNVITDGLLAGLNTNSATIGDPVWLGVNGALIYGLINKPYAPTHLVYIGVVTRVHATVGEILVKVQNGAELKEIHDVDLITNAPKNNDVLTYDSASSLWKNKQSNYLQIVSKDITDSAALTGTTAITLMKSILIPANTYATGEVVKMLSRAVRNTATGTGNNYFYINTTNSLTGATLIGNQSGTNSFYGMERSLYIKSSTNSETIGTSTASGSEVAIASAGSLNINIDWTVNQYIISAFKNAAVGDSTVMSSLIIQKY